jgi:hypothetical protein
MYPFLLHTMTGGAWCPPHNGEAPCKELLIWAYEQHQSPHLPFPSLPCVSAVPFVLFKMRRDHIKAL